MDFENEILMDLGDLEEINRSANGTTYDFPVVHLGEANAYCNEGARTMLGDSPYVKYGITSEYIVMMPCEGPGKTSFKRWNFKGRERSCSRVPIVLLERGFKKGAHRAYKYKDGIALKRYETVEAGR